MSKIGLAIAGAVALVACGRVKHEESVASAGMSSVAGAGNAPSASGSGGLGVGGSGGSAQGGSGGVATAGASTGGESGAGNGGEAGANDLGPPCDPSSDYLRCDGNRVAHCECTKNGAVIGQDLLGGPIYQCEYHGWVEDSVCAVACDAAIAPSTGCVASRQPLPECAQDGSICWNGQGVNCTGGYGLGPYACADGTECAFVDGCGAMCLSPSAQVDARCPAGPGVFNDFCLDNVAYHCSCGYLMGEEPCGDAPHDCSIFDVSGDAAGKTAMCGALP